MLITYETIREAHRREKEEALQKMPEDLISSVRAWLVNRELHRDSNSLIETENAKRLLEDIMNRRERKIVMSALRTVRGEPPPQNMTDEERLFFEKIAALLKERKETIKEQYESLGSIIESQLGETRKSIDEVKTNGKIIRIKTDLPQFVGSDFMNYGPFRIGETTKLPSEIAKILLSRGAAEETQQ